MTAHVIRADARALPLPDASVDLIVTSPPYYGLRSYTDGGEHYAGQIGSEATPAEWLQAMLQCTREWMRVLKPTGSLFVNLGDKYATDPRGPNGSSSTLTNGPQQRPLTARSTDAGVRRKSLIGLPWRYALGCVDDLDLILRAELIWSKVNGLPESVTDRVRRSHETWFHLTKEPRYFASVDEVREEPVRRDAPRKLGTSNQTPRHLAATDNVGWKERMVSGNPLGKLPGSVWEIASEPLKVPDEVGVEHFAAFPMEWPRRLILGWSPSGYCSACFEPRRPAYARGFRIQDDCTQDTAFKRDKHYAGNNWHDKPRGTSLVSRTGEACACPDTSAPTRPAVVLDPFGGTGTTALVASAHGRIGITVDRSADYCRIAEWRTTDPAQRAKALGVDKPPVQLPGQLDLLAGVAA